MNFDLYDIFSKVIPGGIIVFVLIFCGVYTLSDKLPDSVFLLLSYFAGFIIDAIAGHSKVQKYTWKLFGGKTSEILLKNQKYNGKNYPNLKNLKEIASKNNHWYESDLSKTYHHIYRTALSIENSRIKGFNNHWFNARNILFSSLICLIFLYFKIWDGKRMWSEAIIATVTVLVMLYFVFNRAKGRQYEFVKEVFDSYIQNKDKKE